VSHDLLVATRTRPKPEHVASFAAANGAEPTTADGFRPGSHTLLTLSGGEERTIDIDGPNRVELDDLPDDLAGVVSRANWLVEIHVPAASHPDLLRAALDLAIHLARSTDGAVFDPQADRIAWPSGVTPSVRGSNEVRIRVVELDWFVPASAVPPEAATRWLALAERMVPAALPVRFGGYEPFQGRVDRDGTEAFVRAWQDEATVPFGSALYWTAAGGGLSGSVTFPDTRHELRPARLGRVLRLTADFDARPLHRDPARCEAIAEFFVAVAETFGAAFAAGSVTRDTIVRRGRTWSDQRTEWPPIPRASWWVGLPALPSWLSWYGPAYRDLVANALPVDLTATRASGLLVRHGAEPKDIDELQGVASPLPADLLARRRDGAPVDPEVRIGLTSGPPSEPAEVIPWID
jgi:hypothetical protein